MILGAVPGQSLAVRAKFRRWLAVLCVSLFVFSGFLHTIQHVEAAANSAVAEMSVSGTDDGDAGPDKPAASAEHCCGCAPAAMPLALHTQGPCMTSTGVEPMPVALLAEHPARHDPPPPRTLT